MPRLSPGEHYTPQTAPVRRQVRRTGGSPMAQRQGRGYHAPPPTGGSPMAQRQGRGFSAVRAQREARRIQAVPHQGLHGITAGPARMIQPKDSLFSRLLMGSDAEGDTEFAARNLLWNYLAKSPVGRGLEQAQLRSDFERSRPNLAPGAKAPAVKFISGLTKRGMLGYVGGDLPKGTIGLDASAGPQILRGMGGALASGQGKGSGAELTFLHELAHQSQPKSMFPKGGGEGKWTDPGADLFSVTQSSKLGMQPLALYGKAAGQAGQFLRRYGLKGVRSQFKGQ